MRILVVEDEKPLATAVKRGHETNRFAVDIAHDGTDGLWLAQEGSYDVIVLDILLPGLNGYKVCSELRAGGTWTPILMLTAKVGECDEIEALDTGADDFLSKPFSFAVLLARLRALASASGCRGPRSPAGPGAGHDRVTTKVWGMSVERAPGHMARQSRRSRARSGSSRSRAWCSRSSRS
jgi:DNA-binding response OmpR family regulator